MTETFLTLTISCGETENSAEYLKHSIKLYNKLYTELYNLAGFSSTLILIRLYKEAKIKDIVMKLRNEYITSQMLALPPVDIGGQTAY